MARNELIYVIVLFLLSGCAEKGIVEGMEDVKSYKYKMTLEVDSEIGGERGKGTFYQVQIADVDVENRTIIAQKQFIEGSGKEGSAVYYISKNVMFLYIKDRWFRKELAEEEWTDTETYTGTLKLVRNSNVSEQKIGTYSWLKAAPTKEAASNHLKINENSFRDFELEIWVDENRLIKNSTKKYTVLLQEGDKLIFMHYKIQTEFRFDEEIKIELPKEIREAKVYDGPSMTDFGRFFEIT